MNPPRSADPQGQAAAWGGEPGALGGLSLLEACPNAGTLSALAVHVLENRLPAEQPRQVTCCHRKALVPEGLGAGYGRGV